MKFIPKSNMRIAMYKAGSIVCWKPIKLPFWAFLLSEPLRNGLAYRIAMKKRPPNAVFITIATSLIYPILK